MKIRPRVLFVLWCAAVLTSCASQPHKASHQNLKLETIDHGPMRPKTYLYRQVDDPTPPR